MIWGLLDFHLEALAPHHLDEDRELELAAPGDAEGVGRVRLLDADGDVGAALLPQPLAELGGGDEAPLLARERRDVGGVEHRHRRLVDVHDGQGHGLLEVADGLADLHRLDAGHRHQLARGGLGNLHALEPLVAVEHRHLARLHAAVAVDHRHPIVLADAAVDDAADDEPAHVVVPVERGCPEL